MKRYGSLSELLDEMLDQIAADNKKRCEIALLDVIELWVAENPRRARDELSAFRFCEKLQASARFILH